MPSTSGIPEVTGSRIATHSSKLEACDGFGASGPKEIEQPEVWNFEVGARSGIWAVPVDVDAVRGCPVLVDFDEDGGGEAEQCIAAGEDADLAGAAFDLLLDRPLDGVGGTHAPPVLLRQGEDGE